MWYAGGAEMREGIVPSKGMSFASCDGMGGVRRPSRGTRADGRLRPPPMGRPRDFFAVVSIPCFSAALHGGPTGSDKPLCGRPSCGRRAGPHPPLPSHRENRRRRQWWGWWGREVPWKVRGRHRRRRTGRHPTKQQAGRPHPCGEWWTRRRRKKGTAGMLGGGVLPQCFSALHHTSSKYTCSFLLLWAPWCHRRHPSHRSLQLSHRRSVLLLFCPPNSMDLQGIRKEPHRLSPV